MQHWDWGVSEAFEGCLCLGDGSKPLLIGREMVMSPHRSRTCAPLAHLSIAMGQSNACLPVSPRASWEAADCVSAL